MLASDSIPKPSIAETALPNPNPIARTRGTVTAVTVPLVLAMGLGLGNAVSAIEGFGILSLASICPIVAVLTMGLVIQMTQKTKVTQES